LCQPPCAAVAGFRLEDNTPKKISMSSAGSAQKRRQAFPSRSSVSCNQKRPGQSLKKGAVMHDLAKEQENLAEAERLALLTI
jgi:hypothetical protein